MRRCVRELGFKGIRVLPWLWELPPTHARFYPVYAECCELGVPFLRTIFAQSVAVTPRRRAMSHSSGSSEVTGWSRYSRVRTRGCPDTALLTPHDRPLTAVRQ